MNREELWSEAAENGGTAREQAELAEKWASSEVLRVLGEVEKAGGGLLFGKNMWDEIQKLRREYGGNEDHGKE